MLSPSKDVLAIWSEGWRSGLSPARRSKSPSCQRASRQANLVCLASLCLSDNGGSPGEQGRSCLAVDGGFFECFLQALQDASQTRQLMQQHPDFLIRHWAFCISLQHSVLSLE
ncbi:hypothetical protein Hrubri_1448 [Herbaspirillum rubrisubalbicans M1]|nr:hypothetical protein Hrubri_1448 [Herbaspirillum rubrisubalbicans M1]